MYWTGVKNFSVSFFSEDPEWPSPSSILTSVRFSGWLSDCNIAWRASRSWRKSSAQSLKIQCIMPNLSYQMDHTKRSCLVFQYIIYSNHLLLRGPSFKSFGSVDTKQPSNSTTLHFVLASNKTTSCQTVSNCGICSQFVTIQSLNSAYHRLPSSHLQHLARATSGGGRATNVNKNSLRRDKPRNFSCAFPFGTSTGSGSGAQKGSEGVDVLEVETQIYVIATKRWGGTWQNSMFCNHERFFGLTYLWPTLNLSIWLLVASNKSRRMRISRAWWSCICALP